MRFKELDEEQKDKIRLCAFVEEGRFNLVTKLFDKYKGRLIDIVISHERAKELYFGLCWINKQGLAYRFLKELGLQKSVSDYIQNEYRASINSSYLKLIPSVKELRELIGPL